jgi:hypothetical protein
VRFAVLPNVAVGLVVPVLVALAVACTGSPPDAEPSARAAAAITNGADDGADPAVVAIVDGQGQTACSGTVVAPHLVLTAAHCTVPEILQGARAVFGASAGAGDASIPIVAARPHPQFDPSTFANDVALVVLGSTAPASPVPLGSSAPAVGETVRVVGYGFAAADAAVAGTKRQGTASVSAVADTTFEVTPAPSQPCDGDSGGPALAPSAGAEAVVGVTSHGDGACAQHATCTRVDAFAAGFLAPTMASLADGSAPVGSRCLFPEQCSGGAAACIAAPDDPNVTYCTASCGSSSDCPAGMQCASAPGGASQCRYPTPTPGALGASCASDSDCVDGTCTAAGVCGVRCVPGATTCPSGFECDDIEGGIDFFCLPAPAPAPQPIARGSCTAAPPSPAFPAGWIAAPLALALAGLARRHALRRARMRAGTMRR